MNFSVLLSIYYKENPSYLDKALNSVFNQTVTPSEVVLVKDGVLTDDLDAVINSYQLRYPILKILSLKENKGLGFALNEGINICTNDWIARMDTDDICFSNRFEKQIEIIEKNPNLSFVGSAIAEFENTPDNILSYRKLPESQKDIYQYAKERCPLNHPTVMYRKEVIMNLGGYREFPEDYHLWVRALMKGYLFYNIQEPLLYFRINLDTMKRRGGLKYALIEAKHQKEFYNLGFLTYSEYLKNSIIRFGIRIIPAKIRQYFYLKFLRSKN